MRSPRPAAAPPLAHAHAHCRRPPAPPRPARPGSRPGGGDATPRAPAPPPRPAGKRGRQPEDCTRGAGGGRRWLPPPGPPRRRTCSGGPGPGPGPAPPGPSRCRRPAPPPPAFRVPALRPSSAPGRGPVPVLESRAPSPNIPPRPPCGSRGPPPPQRPPVRPLPSCPSPSGQLTSPQPGDRDFPPQPARISPFLSAAAPKTDPRPPAGAGLARDPSALLSCRNAPYPDLLPALSPARQAPCLPEKRVPRCGAPSRSASPGACPRARSTSRLVCQSHFG